MLRNDHVEQFYLLKNYNQRGTAVEETIQLQTRDDMIQETLNRIAGTRTHSLALSLALALSLLFIVCV